eukprot:8601985-Lingulodinium_polyedra.AAC.1
MTQPGGQCTPTSPANDADQQQAELAEQTPHPPPCGTPYLADAEPASAGAAAAAQPSSAAEESFAERVAKAAR